MDFLIYKYQIDRPENTFGESDVSLPAGCKILSCQVQGAFICLWVECASPIKPLEFEQRRFWVVATGRPFVKTPELEYIATVQQGNFVWHVYEEHG